MVGPKVHDAWFAPPHGLVFVLGLGIILGMATAAGSSFHHQPHVLELRGEIFLAWQKRCNVRGGFLCQEYGTHSFQRGWGLEIGMPIPSIHFGPLHL